MAQEMIKIPIAKGKHKSPTGGDAHTEQLAKYLCATALALPPLTGSAHPQPHPPECSYYWTAAKDSSHSYPSLAAV